MLICNIRVIRVLSFATDFHLSSLHYDMAGLQALTFSFIFHHSLLDIRYSFFIILSCNSCLSCLVFFIFLVLSVFSELKSFPCKSVLSVSSVFLNFYCILCKCHLLSGSHKKTFVGQNQTIFRLVVVGIFF